MSELRRYNIVSKYVGQKIEYEFEADDNGAVVLADGAVTLVRELREEIERLEWKPITTDNLPNGYPHLLYMDRDGENVYAMGYFNRLTRSWFINDVDQGRDVEVGYTHFRAINPPEAAHE